VVSVKRQVEPERGAATTQDFVAQASNEGYVDDDG
jgi:hypothetical protein